MINKGPYGQCTNKNNLAAKYGALANNKEYERKVRKQGRRTKVWHISYKLQNLHCMREWRRDKNLKLHNWD